MLQHEREFGFETRALHAGTPPDPATGSRAMPIHQTAAFVFGSTEQAAELFALRSYGHIYSRISNPTVAAFEERMASLEGGLGGIAFSSGLAAQLGVVLSAAQAGDHLVCTQNVYGGTVTQLAVTVKRMGIETTFVPAGDLDAVRSAIRPQTKLVFVETVGNPSGVVADLRAFARLAHDAGVPLVVDNTFATPYLCRPIEHGADIVVHSATKFINGHGTSIGGVLVESGTFPWGNGRFPQLLEPSKGYHGIRFRETFGDIAYIVKARVEGLRDFGPALSPFNSFLFLQGIETLKLRMEAHSSNALRVAGFLEAHDRVQWVQYPGLKSSKYSSLAK